MTHAVLQAAGLHVQVVRGHIEPVQDLSKVLNHGLDCPCNHTEFIPAKQDLGNLSLDLEMQVKLGNSINDLLYNLNRPYNHANYEVRNNRYDNQNS